MNVELLTDYTRSTSKKDENTISNIIIVVVVVIGIVAAVIMRNNKIQRPCLFIANQRVNHSTNFVSCNPNIQVYLVEEDEKRVQIYSPL